MMLWQRKCPKDGKQGISSLTRRRERSEGKTSPCKGTPAVPVTAGSGKQDAIEEEKESALRDARLQKRLDDEEEGRFFEEVRKTLAEMRAEDPNLNTIPIKACFKSERGLDGGHVNVASLELTL